MKITFKDEKNQNLPNLQMKDIRLSSQNPRYTTLKSIQDDLKKIITSSQNDDQNQTKNQLLRYEGDFLDLKNLLQSILDIGFDSTTENILLVKHNNSYFVAEGNRRIMSLKFVLDELVIDELNKIQSIEHIENLQLEDDSKSENYKDRRGSNYKRVLELIKQIKEKNFDFVVHVKIVKDSRELWRIIYTKHIVGERPGMRKWNRGKYFTDILSFFENGIKENGDLFKEIRTLLQREPSVIMEDFKHAQFVKEVLKRAKIYPVSLEEVTDKMVYEKMKQMKISALQYNFSLKRIKDAAKEILNIDNIYFEKNFLGFTFKKDNLLHFDVDNKLDSILKFIYWNFSRGIITTRPIKSQDKNNFNLGVKNILMGTAINTKESQPPERLKELNSFDYSIAQLKEIVKVWRLKNTDDTEIKRFEITQKIKENNEKLRNVKTFEVKILSNKEPKNVFQILRNQYFHNEEHSFLNAMGSTIRSILEQIIIWGSYFVDDVVGSVVSGGEEISRKKEKYIQKIATNKIHDIFSTIKKNNFNLVDLEEILTQLTKSSKENETKFIYNNKKDVNLILSELVHASHRIYKEKSFNKMIEKFQLWQQNIISIVEDIDLDRIDNLSNEIQKYI